MSVAVPYSQFLKWIIVSDNTRGIYVEQLAALFKFRFDILKQELIVPNGLYAPMTEMYLINNDITYQMEWKGRRTLVRGIRFADEDANALYEILSTGLPNSQESLIAAQKLHNKLFESSETPSSQKAPATN